MLCACGGIGELTALIIAGVVAGGVFLVRFTREFIKKFNSRLHFLENDAIATSEDLLEVVEYLDERDNQ